MKLSLNYKLHRINSVRNLFFTILFVFSSSLVAQTSFKVKVKDVQGKVGRRVDNTIDKGVDKTLDGVEDLFKKNKKKKQEENTQSTPKLPEEETLKKESSLENEQKKEPVTTKNSNNDTLALAYISKFDFIPGDKIFAVENFELDQIGDFPNLWDTDASGEIVTISGKSGKWLKLGRDGFFLPEFFKELPENFTLEFDVMVNEEYSWFSSPLGIAITNSETSATWRPDKRQRTSSGLLFKIHPVNAASTGGVASMMTFLNGTETMSSEQEQLALSTAWRLKTKHTKVHVSIWKQGQRFRIYLNEKKYWDLPRAFSKDIIHNKFFFLTQNGKEGEHFFLSNFTLAVGTPDTRSKLITEGSLTTNGITFEVNSDKVKEESYGVIKEIAAVLDENPKVRIKIIGHTDSDGNNSLNKELSLKRAISVQSILISNFKIDQSRLEVEGKGSSEPVVENTTPLNKALNRRVQFIKL
jgi:OmpA-OmpF porin, OOP family